jgi:very-short-patch-repair endonuclease
VLVTYDASGVVEHRVVHSLRAALVPLLTEGSWNQIEDDHRKVGLAWRPDFEPGSGKPKYVRRVLDDLPDAEVIAVARRALERLHGPRLLAVEDVLLWIDAHGIAHVSEVTRLALANALDGRRLHPSEAPDDVLGRFAQATHSTFAHRFEYAGDGSLVCVEGEIFKLFGAAISQSPTTTSHLALLDAYGFRTWPDARLFRLIEFLVHPVVRQGNEQASFVRVLNALLVADRFELVATEHLSGHPVFKVRSVGGVAGRPKNLIFASTGPKPELGFADAVNNDIVILKHAEHCLVYDEPIGDEGLRWMTLVAWWAARERLDPANASTRTHLGERLIKSLGSEPERRLFKAYFKILRSRFGDALPALIPQVYLHYDPITLRELRARGEDRRFDAQRMDFLLLLPHSARVVVEIDGQQHYSTGLDASAKPSPEEYGRTVRADRNLRLGGYEVYRFGGHELRDEEACVNAIDDFFTRLFRRHKVLDVSSGLQLA